MIEQERRASGQPRDRGAGCRPDREPPENLFTRKFHHGEKTFFVDLKENWRGRCLSIKEVSQHGPSRVVIDIDALAEILEALRDAQDFHLEHPAI